MNKSILERCCKCKHYVLTSVFANSGYCSITGGNTYSETICSTPKNFEKKEFSEIGYCFNCIHYIGNDPANLKGICLKTKEQVKSNAQCVDTAMYFRGKEENKVIKFGDLLPLIRCEFVVEYKGEIYHSFGNTLQSVLREHFKDLTVKELTTYDEECLKVVIK